MITQPVRYRASNAKKIDLGTKVIFKYPSPLKNFDVGKMVVDGRHPVDGFIIEASCNFVMYILKGVGKVYAGGQIFEVKRKDVVFVPKKNKFAVQGRLEYITFDSPAYFPEQSREVK